METGTGGLSEPAGPGPTEGLQAAGLVRVIGWSIIACASLAFLFDVAGGNVRSALSLTGISAGVAGALFLAQKGRLQAAILSMVAIVQLGGAVLVAFGGLGLHDVAMMVFPSTLVATALLVERRAFIRIGVANVVFVLLLGTAELGGLLHLDVPGLSDVGTVADAATIVALTAVMVGLLADSLKRSLARSHEQEVSLQAANAELVRHAHELAASEERFRSLIELAVDAILLGEADGRLVAGNRRASELCLLEPAALPGVAFDSLFEREAGAGEWPADLPADGAALTTERSLRRSDGTTVPVEISAKRMPGGGFQAFLRDISARRAAETERAQLEEQLRQAQKMEAVGRVAGGMAHDFNNVLMIVRSAAALACRDVLEGSRSARCLVEIDQAAERASALTRQLLAFSRKQELAPRRLDLCELVRGLRPMLEGALGGRARLELALPACPVLVEVDAPQTEHALLNLAMNARDAMPSGGVVSVAISTIELGARAAASVGVVPGRCARLTVADTGCGMSSEVRERVFEPFFTTKEHGTGLGLALVYGAVRQSRGAIEVDSAPGRGTTFRILLPLVEAP